MRGSLYIKRNTNRILLQQKSHCLPIMIIIFGQWLKTNIRTIKRTLLYYIIKIWYSSTLVPIIIENLNVISLNMFANVRRFVWRENGSVREYFEFSDNRFDHDLLMNYETCYFRNSTRRFSEGKKKKIHRDCQEDVNCWILMPFASCLRDAAHNCVNKS